MSATATVTLVVALFAVQTTVWIAVLALQNRALKNALDAGISRLSETVRVETAQLNGELKAAISRLDRLEGR